MRYLLSLAAFAASPAFAQVAYPPAASSAEVAAVQTAAQQAKTSADNAATVAQAAQSDAQSALAAIPLPANTVPPSEMVGGAMGSSPRYRRADDVIPRISRTVSGTTASNGQGTVSWPAMPSVPKLTVTPYVSSTAVTLPPSCYPVAGTVTTTGATIKCYVDQTILGTGLAPRASAVAGVAFDVLALPAS